MLHVVATAVMIWCSLSYFAAFSIYLLFALFEGCSTDGKLDYKISNQHQSQIYRNFIEESFPHSCSKNHTISCPVWSYCNYSSNSCKCVDISTGRFMCDGLEEPKVLECNCVSYNNQKLEIGFCIYNCMFHQKHTSEHY